MPGRTANEPRNDRLGPMRAEVLHHLRLAGRPLPVAEIATAVGLHPNTTRFHLDALTSSGLVTRTVEQRDHPGRPKVLYASVAAHRVDHYQDLAVAMVRHVAGDLPDRAERIEAAGRAWGERLRAEHDPTGSEPEVERLVQVMSDLGYEPDYIESPSPTVVVQPCPFMSLVGDDPEIICGLHLGLVHGLMGPDAAWDVTGVEPFATPSTCLIHLARRAPDPTAGTAGEEQADA